MAFGAPCNVYEARQVTDVLPVFRGAQLQVRIPHLHASHSTAQLELHHWYHSIDRSLFTYRQCNIMHGRPEQHEP